MFVENAFLRDKMKLKKQKFENYVWTDFPVELKCETCDEVKAINCFPKRKDTQLGIRRNCKMCISFKNHNYRENNLYKIRNQQKEYYLRNTEKIKQYIRNITNKTKKKSEINKKIIVKITEKE